MTIKENVNRESSDVGKPENQLNIHDYFPYSHPLAKYKQGLILKKDKTIKSLTLIYEELNGGAVSIQP